MCIVQAILQWCMCTMLYNAITLTLAKQAANFKANVKTLGYLDYYTTAR